jgi:hypothetical protein
VCVPCVCVCIVCVVFFLSVFLSSFRPTSSNCINFWSTEVDTTSAELRQNVAKALNVSASFVQIAEIKSGSVLIVTIIMAPSVLCVHISNSIDFCFADFCCHTFLLKRTDRT